MQSTLDMSIATTVCDSARMAACCEGGDQSKAASASGDEGTQQRFADVLPLARAALEKPSEDEAVAQDMAEGESAGIEPDEDESIQPTRPACRQGETEPADSEAVGWAFIGIIQSVAQPQAQANAVAVESPKAVDGAQTTVPAGSEPAATEQTAMTMSSGRQTSTSDVGSTLVSEPAQSQTTVDAQLVDASVERDIAAGDVVVGKPQAVSSVVPAQDTSLPVSTGGEQAASARQLARETPAADRPQVVQTAPHITQAQRAAVQSVAKNGQTQSLPVAEAMDSTSQAPGAKTPDVPKSALGRLAAIAAETTGQASGDVETPGRSEKSVRQQTASQDGQRSEVLRRPEVVSIENTTIEPVESGVKNVSTSAVKDTAMMSFQQSVSSGAETAVFSLRPVTQAQTQPQVSTDTSAARSPVQSIGEQILDSVQASATRGDRQVLVRLNPPELGTVLVRFQEQGDQLTGTLEVSSREARREIEQALPQVARTLQEAGVQIRRLEVVASDQFEGDLSREHLAQDAWSQHQGAGQGREQSSASPQTRWSQSRGGHGVTPGATPETQSQATPAQGRIDLLL